VPALQLDSGHVLTEGPAIVQYLPTSSPASGLAPAAGTPERYKLQEWLNFISSEIHKSMGSMFNAAQTPEWREAVKVTLANASTGCPLSWKAKPYLMGEKFSVADGYCLPC